MTMSTASVDPTDSIIAQVAHCKGKAFDLKAGNRVLRVAKEKAREGVEIWLEQRIWGHRFLNDQTPWLLLLETLNIIGAYASDLNQTAIFPGVGEQHENRRYSMQARPELRYLLFRDRSIDEIAGSQSISDGSQWASWFERYPDGAERGTEQFGYLRDRFVNFNALRRSVTLLRGAVVEPERDRRPTSRHLVPRGIDMLTADYGESRGKKGGVNVNKDRRFFARGGELLYLMLNRSGSRSALESLVRERLVGSGSRWNMLARAIQPNASHEITIDGFGYLPLASHPSYDRVAEDWVALLSLSALPDDSLPEPLMRLSGLAVLQYVIERAADVLGERRPPFPIDMLGPETVNVQKLSKDCFARHRELSRKAIKKLACALTDSEGWHEARSKPNAEKALKELLQRAFSYKPDATTAEEMANEIQAEALDNHDQHLGRVVGFYADQIGLTVARRGNGRWYASSDGMLEALVFANVTAPVEFEAFLEKLWHRYGFVIGSEAGRQEFPEGNYEHFKANQLVLEDRLRILGLLKRLSDDCAFVINPFYRHSEVGK
jgi:hypothetical protein